MTRYCLNKKEKRVPINGWSCAFYLVDIRKTTIHDEGRRHVIIRSTALLQYVLHVQLVCIWKIRWFFMGNCMQCFLEQVPCLKYVRWVLWNLDHILYSQHCVWWDSSNCMTIKSAYHLMTVICMLLDVFVWVIMCSVDGLLNLCWLIIILFCEWSTTIALIDILLLARCYILASRWDIKLLI